MADAAPKSGDFPAPPPVKEEEVSLRPTGMTSMLSGGPPGLTGVSLRPGGGGMGFGSKMISTIPKKEVSVPRSKKVGGEPTLYKKEFLMRFKERCVEMPAELVGQDYEILLVDETEPSWKDSQSTEGPSGTPRQGKQEDSRDWRARAELPDFDHNEGGGGKGGKGERGGKGGRGGRGGRGGHHGHHNQQQTQMPEGSVPIPISKSANPWQPVKKNDISEKDKKLRAVKGILNKLTPEKFEKLTDQLLALGIETAELLQGVISLVFDKAVAEPGFCTTYAKLCVRLSKALPEFPAMEGETKPMTFRRILLNTCQEEFEGAAQQRADTVAQMTSDMTEEETEQMMRKVKLRTLGNIRLIGELFKEKMIMEKILHACITQLLNHNKTAKNSKEVPPEENVEALCNLLKTVGATLDLSQRSKEYLEDYFVRLTQLSRSPKLASRIRFMCRDVVDLRKNKWVPRREVLQAKTLDEVHAEAAKEMGLTGRSGVPPGTSFDDDAAMFPEGPSGAPVEDGWEVQGRGGKKSGGQNYSALTGPYTAIPKGRPLKPPPPGSRPVQQPKAAEETAAASAPAPVEDKAPAKKMLSEEDATNKCKNLCDEFLSARDVKEVELSLKEIEESMTDKEAIYPLFAKKCIDHIIDKSSEKDCDMIMDMLAKLANQGVLKFAMITDAIDTYMEDLQDLSMDVPMAPKLIATCISVVIMESKSEVSLMYLQDACLKMEDVFTRKDLAFATLGVLKAKGPFMKLVMNADKFNVKDFLLDEGESEDDLKKDLERVKCESLLQK
mmetsp:Transcript_13925/g.16778  ORF Transcript_13925/g.16778 Transcript_13925/m.16778 type:complete len:782 (+) Transcript_13925:82-2427(+)|eukprot:CAMPEP_0197850602 /NCGR_PEP_ID=MMETSP1438-20131217/15844_1 /TAXON_ID=1461541 /ORGANISM="Pterosperma sp., Strain CCMP1384" /LENGTH=781 /DNA_ID=CAMNT_0043463847 /DNA_START=79 /DNA_END=2424 /DNA_ORIENTATION=-